MGVGRRILTYLIVALAALFILSCITIYRHREYLAQYFTSSLSAAGGIFVYVLIIGVGIAFLLRALLA